MLLYHRPGSRSARVRWLLEEIGAPYELITLDAESKQSAEHRSRHPLGRVPAIDDGEGFVFESAAILLQLADLHPDARLIAPIGTHERALVYQWFSFGLAEVERPGLELFAARRRSDAQAEVEPLERFLAAAAVVEQALDGHDYIVADRFSVADILCAGVLGIARRLELLETLPQIAAYLERLDARPARQRAYSDLPATK
jgi:glutathione S-transferase